MPRFPVAPQDYAIHTGRSWRIRNLSLSGAFIEDREPLESGKTVYLELHLGQERIPCQGIVRRSVPREGMGVQFENIGPETKDRLERYLNTLEKSAAHATAAAQVAPSLPEEEVAEEAETSPSQALAARLHNLGAELRALEEDIKAGQVDVRVLQEFRESVDQIRVTAWLVGIAFVLLAVACSNVAGLLLLVRPRRLRPDCLEGQGLRFPQERVPLRRKGRLLFPELQGQVRLPAVYPEPGKDEEQEHRESRAEERTRQHQDEPRGVPGERQRRVGGHAALTGSQPPGRSPRGASRRPGRRGAA